MSVYLLHHRGRDLSARPSVRLRDFASKELLNEADPLPLHRHDALRTIIGESSRGDPREFSPSVTVTFPDTEFIQPNRTRDDFLDQKVIWAERFNTTLILHSTPPPFRVDGALICFTECDASIVKAFSAQTSRLHYQPIWQRYANLWLFSLTAGDVLCDAVDTPPYIHTPRYQASVSGALEPLTASPPQI